MAGREAHGRALNAARQLVVNADDFGLTPGVNRGILEAHEAGVVTSASLLVNAPGFADAVARARAMPTLGVGLHLNFTLGRPLAAAAQRSSLRDPGTGEFYSLPRLVLRALAGRITTAHVAAECAAQIERFRGTGLAITHLDAHHHAHLLPGIWPVVVAAVQAAGIGFLRVPLEPMGTMAWRPLAALGQAVIAASYRVAARRGTVPRHADHFRGFALTGSAHFRERLLALLDALEPGVTELMVHPGHVDGSLKELAHYREGRSRELAALTAPAVRARLDRGDIDLVHFGNI